MPAGLPSNVTRRNFIVWYLAGLLVALVAAVVSPILVYIYPPASQTKNRALNVDLSKPIGRIQNGEGVRFEAPREHGFIMADGGGANAPGGIAFSGYVIKGLDGRVNVLAVNCPHLGCSVQVNTDAKRFDCPCHGSHFDLDGAVTRGPALHPLSHLNWKQGARPNAIVVEGRQLPGIG